MDKLLDHVRTTLVGGAVFVLPLLLVIFIMKKAVDLLDPITDAVVARLGVHTLIGAATTTVFSLLLLVLIAFLFGVFARTLVGQSFVKWMQAGILSALPRFNLVQGLARSVDNDQGKEVPVVLVPTDAGWCLGLQLEEQHGDWCPVYIPGSPQWTSGSVSFAHINDVHKVDVPLGRILFLMRRCGMGSTDVCDILADLKAKGTI